MKQRSPAIVSAPKRLCELGCSPRRIVGLPKPHCAAGTEDLNSLEQSCSSTPTLVLAQVGNAMRGLLLFLFSHRFLALARWEAYFIRLRLINSVTGRSGALRRFT